MSGEANETTCPRCDQVNVRRDFCSRCGEYLRWDPTMFIPTIDPARTAVVGRPPGVLRAALVPHVGLNARPSAQATLDLSAPGPIGSDGEPHVSVIPGNTVQMLATVRNESAIVDNYDIRVVGIPDEWWTVTPATAYLVPFGTGSGRSEQEVQVALHPPRDPACESRDWPIQVVARSRARGMDVASADAVLVLEPYQELDATLRPARRAGRRRADYTLRVANLANAPTKVLLDGIDPDNQLLVSFFVVGRPNDRAIQPHHGPSMVHEVGRYGMGPKNPEYMARMAFHNALSGTSPLSRIFGRRGRKNKREQVIGLEVDPGSRAQAIVRVAPSRQTIIGRTRNRPFQVMVEPARAPGVAGDGPVVAGTFRQRAWIPWWLAILVPLGLAALLFFLLTRPKFTTVPNVKSATSVLAAEGSLRRAHLRLGETLSVPNDTVRAGSVTGQSPGPGTRVERDTPITIQIATSTGKVEVPRIVGLTQAQAIQVLKQKGLQIGPALVPPANPTTSTIASQTPIEGTAVAQGDVVNPIYSAPAQASGSTQRPQSGPAPAGGGGGGGKTPEGPRVPDVVRKQQTAAAKLIAERGYSPKVLGEFSADVPAGAIIRQHPPANALFDAGGTVEVVVSRGIPEVVFSDNFDIVGIGGAKGRPRRGIAATANVEVHPAVSSDGLKLAYRSGAPGAQNPLDGTGQIWIASLADPLSAQPLTNPGFDDRRPAFSPDGATIAFASDRIVAGDPDLCFVSLASAGGPVSCIPDPSTAVTRPTWSPDGSMILATAKDPQGQVELLRYDAATPNTANPAAWTSAGFVTDGMHGNTNAAEQVTSSAFSPNGNALAFAANWNDGVFRVYIAQVRKTVIASTAKPLPRVPGCELAWRPDSAEILVAWRDGTCDGTGQIVRVDVKHPENVTLLTQVGRNSGDPVFGTVSEK